MANRLGKDENDNINIKTDGKENKYKIIAIVDTYENMGNVIFVSQATYDSKVKNPDYQQYMISVKKDSDASKVLAKIEGLLKDEVYFNIQTREDMMKTTNQENSLIFSIVNLLIAIVLFATLIGLINNLIIGLLQRKKDVAILKTLGFTNFDLWICFMFEAIVLGMVTGVTGLFYGLFLNDVVANFVQKYVGTVIRSSMVIPHHLIFMSLLICVICYSFSFMAIQRKNEISTIRGDE